MVEIKDRDSKNRTALIASFLDCANIEQFLIQVINHFSYENLVKNRAIGDLIWFIYVISVPDLCI